MDRDRFYDLIDDARAGSGSTSPSADPDELRGALDELDDDELVAFARAFDREHAKLDRWDLWGVGYLLNGGMSDDGFHYFRSWLIGKGEDAVGQALDDPDGLVDYLGDDDADAGFENEELEYAATELLDDRGIDVDDDSGSDGTIGEEFDEDSLEEAYPRIAAWLAARERRE